MGNLVFLLVVAAVVGAGWWWGRPSALFVVRVRSGRPAAVRGRVTEAFLVVVAEVFGEFGLSAGEVRGVARGRGIALGFSANVPPGARQRLRNWWALSGWGVGRGRG